MLATDTKTRAAPCSIVSTTRKILRIALISVTSVASNSCTRMFGGANSSATSFSGYACDPGVNRPLVLKTFQPGPIFTGEAAEAKLAGAWTMTLIRVSSEAHTYRCRPGQGLRVCPRETPPENTAGLRVQHRAAGVSKPRRTLGIGEQSRFRNGSTRHHFAAQTFTGVKWHNQRRQASPGERPPSCVAHSLTALFALAMTVAAGCLVPSGHRPGAESLPPPPKLAITSSYFSNVSSMFKGAAPGLRLRGRNCRSWSQQVQDKGAGSL